MKLHVLTPVTRPQNLVEVGRSLERWGEVDMTWHLKFDWFKRSLGGYALRNRMLDDIHDGYVWCLDDDCTAHPKLYQTVRKLARGDAPAIVVSQQREDGGILHAKPENLMVDYIDIGQAVIRRDVIGDHRYRTDEYAADGVFLEAVLGHVPVVFVDQVLSFHNNIQEVP